jgi:hypothetical protein
MEPKDRKDFAELRNSELKTVAAYTFFGCASGTSLLFSAWTWKVSRFGKERRNRCPAASGPCTLENNTVRHEHVLPAIRISLSGACSARGRPCSRFFQLAHLISRRIRERERRRRRPPVSGKLDGKRLDDEPSGLNPPAFS